MYRKTRNVSLGFLGWFLFQGSFMCAYFNCFQEDTSDFLERRPGKIVSAYWDKRQKKPIFKEMVQSYRQAVRSTILPFQYWWNILGPLGILKSSPTEDHWSWSVNVKSIRREVQTPYCTTFLFHSFHKFSKYSKQAWYLYNTILSL